MRGTIYWNGKPIPFQKGETVSAALNKAGIGFLGVAPSGQSRALFCGIGQCQGCLVSLNGRLVESCLQPALDGMRLEGASRGDTSV